MNKAFSVVLALAFMTILSFADEKKKSDISDLKKDFTMICEISKLSKKLKASEAFKNDEPDLAVRIATMAHDGIKTDEVKNTLSALAMADRASREKLWLQSASDVGLKNWKCPRSRAMVSRR